MRRGKIEYFHSQFSTTQGTLAEHQSRPGSQVLEWWENMAMRRDIGGYPRQELPAEAFI